jgi:hypothetical protein
MIQVEITVDQVIMNMEKPISLPAIELRDELLGV